MKLIDKDALVAEIEKRLHANGAFDEVGDETWTEDVGMCNAYKSILSFLDTLEVKEVVIETDEEYINKKIEQATPKWKGVDVDEYLKEIRGGNDIDAILTRLDRIYDLLLERLPIIPHIETSPYPPRLTEPWYKSPLNDVQANTGKEEEQ